MYGVRSVDLKYKSTVICQWRYTVVSDLQNNENGFAGSVLRYVKGSNGLVSGLDFYVAIPRARLVVDPPAIRQRVAVRIGGTCGTQTAAPILASLLASRISRDRSPLRTATGA